MKKLFVLMIALLVISAPAFANILVNGDFATGDETAWTRWNCPWGNNFGYSVADGALTLTTPNGSFGLYQWVDTVAGHQYEINGQVMANGSLNWAEVIFCNDDGRVEYDQLDAPVNSSIIFKVDGWGMNGGMPFKSVDGETTWGSITDGYFPSGLQTNVITATGDRMLVGLKAGSVSSTIAMFQNFSVEDVTPVTTPEPASLVALFAGLGGLIIRRKK